MNADDVLIHNVIAHVEGKLAASINTFQPSIAQNMQVTWQGIQFDLPVASDTTGSQPEIGWYEHPGEHEGRSYISHPSTLHFQSRLLGEHHVSTMLAVYAVGRHCGLRSAEIQNALANLPPLPGRLYPLEGVDGARLLDDTHNAVPASVIAGLETLQALPASCRIAVLSDMLRLGDFEEEAHHLIGQKAAQCVDYLILRGEKATLIAESAHKAGLSSERIIITSTHEDAAQAAQNLIKESSQIHESIECIKPIQSSVGADLSRPSPIHRPSIFIKGSEETRMERVTELLMARPERAREQLVRQTPGWKQIVVMRPDRPTWVEIDLSAIAHNTRQIQSLVWPKRSHSGQPQSRCLRTRCFEGSAHRSAKRRQHARSCNAERGHSITRSRHSRAYPGIWLCASLANARSCSPSSYTYTLFN